MEVKTHHISIRSQVYKESFTISWPIKGFNKMPFLEDHPVCGPWFMLGKKRESTWSLLMTKQIHGGVENIGFKLMRAEDDAVWDTATYSLGLKTDSGWFTNVIDRQVVGKESIGKSFVFLMVPTGCSAVVDMSPPVFRSLALVKELLNVRNVHRLEESVGMEGSVGIQNKRRMEEPSVVKGSGLKVEDVCGSEGSSGVKGSTNVENSRSLERSSEVKGSTNVENSRSSEGSSEVKGSTNVENSRRLEVSSGVKGSNTTMNGSDFKSLSGEKESTNAGNCHSFEGSAAVSEKIVENGQRSELLVEVKESKNAESHPDSDRSENVKTGHSLHASTDRPNTIGIENIRTKKRHLTPEELFQQETVTVVCVIEYTYMVFDPIPGEQEPDPSSYVTEAIRDLYTTGKYSDISLESKGIFFLGHKAILCTRSSLIREFMAEQPSSPPELVLKIGLDLSMTKALFHYMYTDELYEEITKMDQCKKLCKAAGQFGLPGLQQLCLEFLMENGEEYVLVKSLEFESDKKSLLSISLDDKAVNAEKFPVTCTQTSN